MASNNISTIWNTIAALVVRTELPPNCIAFTVTNDDSCPHLRPGDVAVVDTSQRYPLQNELFLIEYGRGTRPSRHIVEVWKSESGWWNGAYARRQSWSRGGLVDTVDGPFAGEEGAAYLSEKIIGRVVGVLEPTFEEPKLLAA